MLFNIQGLRAIASLLVVHAHAAGGAGLGLSWVGGANGVDLFFVISGFIISYVATLDADQFMTRRLIRIVPIYWASSAAIYVLALAMPHMFHTVSADPGLFVRSLLFLPDPSSMHQDGMLHPTLGGGWTLNYEMYFYVVFWVALSMSRRWAGLIASGIIVSVIVIVNVTPLQDSVVAQFYGSEIVLEFLYGIAVFHLVRWLADREQQILGAALKPLLVVGVIGGLVCLAFERELFGGEGPRCLRNGIPAFVVVCCAVLLERAYRARITNRVIVAIGDASYVLYLLHAYIVFGLTRLLLGHHAFSEPVGQVVVLGYVAISAACAVAVYHYFEKPVLRRLKAIFVRRTK